MRTGILTLMVFVFVCSNAIAAPVGKGKDEKKPAKPDTTCYLLQEAETKNMNAVRLIISGDKVTGELKYMTIGQPIAAGRLEGTIKDGIVTADWTYIKNSNYYKVPVAFKVTKNAVYQKATAINADGQPYLPDDGEYEFEFPRVDCLYFP